MHISISKHAAIRFRQRVAPLWGKRLVQRIEALLAETVDVPAERFELYGFDGRTRLWHHKAERIVFAVVVEGDVIFVTTVMRDKPKPRRRVSRGRKRSTGGPQPYKRTRMEADE